MYCVAVLEILIWCGGWFSRVFRLYVIVRNSSSFSWHAQCFPAGEVISSPRVSLFRRLTLTGNLKFYFTFLFHSLKARGLSSWIFCNNFRRNIQYQSSRKIRKISVRCDKNRPWYGRRSEEDCPKVGQRRFLDLAESWSSNRNVACAGYR
jgi:hypothetical protein